MSQVIAFNNTKTTLPGWGAPLHESQQLGYAYELNNYFVQIYGTNGPNWAISTGLTTTQKKNGQTLENWVKTVFGATNIRAVKNLAGEAIKGVWRPGLNSDQEVLQALSVTEFERRSSEQAIRILLEKLDELFLYVEPSGHGLNSFSHKARELLILACTEVENTFKYYFSSKDQRLTNSDYIKLKDPLFLEEYELTFKPYQNIPIIQPFRGWNTSKATQSLGWYNAYNQTKHDRSNHFDKATLRHCINAVAANIILFCVRYGPYTILQGNSILSALVNHLFKIQIVNPDVSTFYIPKMIFPDRRTELVCGKGTNHVQSWKTIPFQL